MVLGTWNEILHTNGALPLPADIRSTFADGVVATRGFERCIQLFDHATWNQLAHHVSSLSLGSSQARMLRRLLFGEAVTLHVDAEGIIHLPARLCTYADLSDAVVLMGLNTYVELWSPRGWQDVTERLLALDQPHDWDGM